MNQCEQLHETVVKDILDVMSDVKDFDQIEWIRKRNNVGSINKRSSNLILVFPVIVSSSLSIETAMLISKAIERKCVSLLQILFSSIQITQSDNVYDYIKQFHTNLDLSDHISLDDFLNIMDDIANEGAIQITDKDVYDAVMEDMKNINFMLTNSFNEVSINDYKLVNNMYGESAIVLEAKKRPKTKINNDYNGNTGNILPGARTLNQFEPITTGELKFGDTKSNVNNYYGDARPKSNTKDLVDFYKAQLLPNDIQKANELMPTTMLVNFTTYNKADGKVGTTTGIIGVKAKMYPVDSMDIINRLSSKVKDRNGLFNLVRATTREISFFKDLAFAIDKAKLDAIYMAKDSNNAKIFKLLERRATKNRFSSLLKKNDASPITSLVISQSEVEYLKKYNNLDLDKSYNTRTLLEGYNLMDIIIADESLEIAKFLYDDGDGTFETLTFDALEKESKDNSYKKVVNLMSRINR